MTREQQIQKINIMKQELNSETQEIALAVTCNEKALHFWKLPPAEASTRIYVKVTPSLCETAHLVVDKYNTLAGCSTGYNIRLRVGGMGGAGGLNNCQELTLEVRGNTETDVFKSMLRNLLDVLESDSP